MLAALLIALLLPWLVGLLALRVLRLPFMLTAGAGFFLGMIGLSLLLRAWSGLDLSLQFMPILLPLMLLALVLTPLAVKCRPAAPGAGTGASFIDLSAIARLAYAALLLLLIVRYAALAGEIAWRPLLGWDAWASWAVKAKVWFYQQHITPFVSSEAWLERAGDAVYTVIANDYPATIPLLQTWFALAWGEWLETAANTPWLICALALGLGFYSHCRSAGADALTALLFTYLLLSLPLLNTHVALAGYADLWLTACYGLAALSLLQWCRSGDYRQLGLGLLLGGCLPLIKVDGTVWALGLLVLVLVRALGKGFWILLLLTLVGAVIWYQRGGVQLGSWQITPQLIELPYIGRYELFYTANWAAVRDQLLFGGSWHLLWYLAPLSLLALLFPALRLRSPALFYGAVLFLFDLLVLYVLFFFTQAAQWAVDATSLNRLFMHISPLAVFLLFLLSQAILLSTGTSKGLNTELQSAVPPAQLKNPAVAR